MNLFSKDFGPFDGKVWLNTAAQGPLPHVAVEALREATQWKLKPFQLTPHKFFSTVTELKSSLARLIHVNAEDIILGNSATYGIHLLANGIPFKPGDEVLCMFNDFPTSISPWLTLTKKGVFVRQLKPENFVLTPIEIEKSIMDKTRVVCLSWVHSFSGHKIDVQGIGAVCRKRGVYFILNGTQAAGAFSMDLSILPVDAFVSAGHKWLCGPFATGFCWMSKVLREKLEYSQAYWSSFLSQKDLEEEKEIYWEKDSSSKSFDVFAPANFFNFVPWKATIDYLLGIGMESIESYNRTLVNHFVDTLDKSYHVISPKDKDFRTNLVVFSHPNPRKNAEIFSALKELGIYIALWKEKLRVSPHLYNTPEEIEYVLKALGSLLD